MVHWPCFVLGFRVRGHAEVPPSVTEPIADLHDDRSLVAFRTCMSCISLAALFSHIQSHVMRAHTHRHRNTHLPIRAFGSSDKPLQQTAARISAHAHGTRWWVEVLSAA